MLIFMENTDTKREILVADDEPAVALAIKSAVKYCGYPVHTVSNGEAAIAAVEAEPSRFSLVMSDHNMPGRGGLALVKALRACGFPGRVIILSAFLTKEIEGQYAALGVDQILTKPFNLDALRLALAQAFDPANC
jgi:CheY-like chemotaxis protein